MRIVAAERVRVFMGFDSCFTVECVGRSGGLMVLWRNSIGFSVHSFSRFHVEGLVTDEDDHFWNFLDLYRDPVVSQRKFSWELVRRLKLWSDAPWLVGGDLNEVATNSELSGYRTRGPGLLEEFRMMMEDCDLSDLGFVGDMFTWRRSDTLGCSARRLDMCLGNQGWFLFTPRLPFVISIFGALIIDLFC